jgi:hypothetical protein
VISAVEGRGPASAPGQGSVSLCGTAVHGFRPLACRTWETLAHLALIRPTEGRDYVPIVGHISGDREQCRRSPRRRGTGARRLARIGSGPGRRLGRATARLAGRRNSTAPGCQATDLDTPLTREGLAPYGAAPGAGVVIALPARYLPVGLQRHRRAVTSPDRARPNVDRAQQRVAAGSADTTPAGWLTRDRSPHLAPQVETAGRAWLPPRRLPPPGRKRPARREHDAHVADDVRAHLAGGLRREGLRPMSRQQRTSTGPRATAGVAAIELLPEFAPPGSWVYPLVVAGTRDAEVPEPPHRPCPSRRQHVPQARAAPRPIRVSRRGPPGAVTLEQKRVKLIY